VSISQDPVTYFTKVLANWRADPTAKNNFSYKPTDADRIKGGNAPVKKSKAPVLQAAIGNAGGELQRAGAGGAMSVIGAMPKKKFVPGSAQGVLPVKGDIIETLWTEDGKVKGWFTVEVLLGDVSQRQANEEKRQRYMTAHRQIARMGSSLLARSPHQRPQSRRIQVHKTQGQAGSSIGGGSVALPGPLKSFPWAL
jgi:hypothetical protein